MKIVLSALLTFWVSGLLVGQAAAADDFALAGEWVFLDDSGQTGTLTFTKVDGEKVTGKLKLGNETADVTGTIEGDKLALKVGKEVGVIYLVETYPAIKGVGSLSQTGAPAAGFSIQRKFPKGTEIKAGSNADLIKDLPKMTGLTVSFGAKALELSVKEVAENGTFEGSLGSIPVKGKITANLVVLTIPEMKLGDKTYQSTKVDMVFMKEKKGWTSMDRVQLAAKK